MPKVIAAILLLQSGGVDSSEPPTVTAVRVDRAPVVDGRLDDPEWSLAPAVNGRSTERPRRRGTGLPGYVVDPDGPSASDAKLFTFQDPDFRTRSVKVNAVLRWEYRPGSTLFVVWTQSRSGSWPYDASFDLNRDFQRELFLDRPTNVLLVKFNYWLSL